MAQAKKVVKEKVGYFKRPIYTFIFLRELSSFIIALYGIYFLIKIFIYDYNLQSLYSFLFAGTFQTVLSVIFLVFALLHGITWFSLIPRAQPIKIGSLSVGRIAMVIVWLILSVLFFFIFYYIWFL